MTNEVQETKQIVLQAMRTAVQKALPGETHESDVDGLSRLCVMALVPTGEEDPREICSRLSDPLVTFVVSRMKELQTNPAIGYITKLLLIEWCFRNDYLNADWKWEWKDGHSGQVHFSERVPLDRIPLPKP